MLVVSGIHKQFRGATEAILRNISFTVNKGECVGLIGPNGAGKSTLLKIIMRYLEADTGHVQYIPSELQIGYLGQGVEVEDTTPLIHFLIPQYDDLEKTETALEVLSSKMETAADEMLAASIETYGGLLSKLEMLSEQLPILQAEALMAEFGLGDVGFRTPIGILSGGQKTRLGLVKVLLNQPQLLILDEPTNHLDTDGLGWLTAWINDFDGGVLIVSHDRAFLDDTVDKIVALDGKTHMAQVYEGDYSDYAAAVRSALDKQWSQWRDQQVEIVRLQADVVRTKEKARRKENATKDSTQRRYAKKVAKRAKAKEKRLERYLESDARVEKPRSSWSLKLDLGDLPTTGQDVIFFEDLTVGYKSDTPLLCQVHLTLRAKERIALMGGNGQGKSTLLKTITGEVAPLGGQVRIGASVRIGYLAQEQETLAEYTNALDAIRKTAAWNETEARSFLHFFLFTQDDALIPIHELSYGERTRLMLAILIAQGSNVLILDEPINHLDIHARQTFEEALQNFQGSILAATHDRYFVEQFATTVWHIEEQTIIPEVLVTLVAS